MKNQKKEETLVFLTKTFGSSVDPGFSAPLLASVYTELGIYRVQLDQVKNSNVITS